MPQGQRKKTDIRENKKRKVAPRGVEFSWGRQCKLSFFPSILEMQCFPNNVPPRPPPPTSKESCFHNYQLAFRVARRRAGRSQSKLARPTPNSIKPDSYIKEDFDVMLLQQPTKKSKKNEKLD